MEENLYNVGIIGAGPVGGFLADKLSRLGYKIIVLEKKTSPDYDINCTGIISQECCDLLSINNSSLILRPANSASFVSPSCKRLQFSRNENIANIVDRPLLNLELIRRASLASVKYLFSADVKGIEITDKSVCLTAIINGHHENISCDTVIIATGFGTDLTTKLGLGKISKFVIGAQAEVQLNDTDEIEIFLDRELAPGGFAWLVPTQCGKGLAGLLTHKSPNAYLAKFLIDIERKGKIKSSKVEYHISPIPLRPLPKTYADRILIVGEAAGQVKPTTGGGIYYGILSSEIAARVLQQSFETDNFSAIKLSQYQRLWKAKLAREIAVGNCIHQLWKKTSNNQIEYLFKLAEKKGVIDIINTTKYFSFDWHGSMFTRILYSLTPFAKLGK
jgi:digeranylgeranylglycerophospholipid reductase